MDPDDSEELYRSGGIVVLSDPGDLSAIGNMYRLPTIGGDLERGYSSTSQGSMKGRRLSSPTRAKWTYLRGRLKQF